MHAQATERTATHHAPASGGQQAVPEDGAPQRRRPVAGEVVPPVDLDTRAGTLNSTAQGFLPARM